MATFQFTGLDKYISGLAKIYSGTPWYIKNVVYKGSKVVADAIRTEIEALPEVKGTRVPDGQMINGVTKSQKEGLLDGLGVSSIKNDNGFINAKIGFAGYNSSVYKKRYKEAKKYGKDYHQSNAMIARSVISGTSFRQKNPFVARAVKRVKAQAEAEMAAAFDEAFEKIDK